MKSADVVVIGAGIIGSSVAYYLAKAGVAVTLIDARAPNESGAASQACAGGVRQQNRNLLEIAFSMYAIDLWTGLEVELDTDLDYRQDGMTIVTDDEDLVPLLAQRVKKEQALGLEVQMVMGEELHHLIPGLSPKMLAGSYCPTDGHANPLRVIHALTSAARRRGARLTWQCPAESFVVKNNRVTAVLTSQGRIPCRYAVLAAGCWSRSIAASIGIDLPFESFPLQMMVTARRPHILDQVLGWTGHGISLKQVPSGGFLIGGGWPGHGCVEFYGTRLMPGSMAKNARIGLELFQSLKGLPVVRAWVGIEAFCRDELQIVGPVSCPDGLILAAGFSGHGFATGPAIGSLLARYVTTGKLPDLLKPFGIERFGHISKEKRK